MITDIILFEFIVAVFAAAVVTFFILLRGCIEQTRLPGGRYFGFNCDGCNGKRDNQGQYLLRCKIKPKIVDFLLWSGLIKRRN
jgi:hypothetical protein